MAEEGIRHLRSSIFEALANGRRKATSFLVASKVDEVRTSEENRIMFGFLRISAQKEEEMRNDVRIDDILMDELIPVTVSPTLAASLREKVNILSMQDLLSTSPYLIRQALAEERVGLMEAVLAMVPNTAPMSYTDHTDQVQSHYRPPIQ